MKEDILSPEALSETLMDFGLLNEEQLRLARERAELEATTLRDAVLWFNFLSDEELGKVVADHFRIPYVSLFQKEIGDETLKVIPEVVARSQRIIAFDQDAQGLHVALTDPRNIEILEFLRRKTGVPIIKYYATERDVTEALHRYKKGVVQAFDDILKESIEETKGGSFKETDPPIIRIVDALIQYAYQNKASDIHQEPRDHDALVRFRIDGALHDIVKLPLELHPQIISRIKVLSSLRTDEHQTPQDGKLQVEVDNDQVDIRVSIIPITNGEKAVLRLLSERSRQFSLGNLGLDGASLEKVQSSYHKPFGMILVTGPTGSGKTTTLYSILKLLNHRDVNIVTIEDPVEYDVEGVNQIQVNSDAQLTFATGLRSILRQDPNIILVGEIRDDETAGIATNLAMTGHLVLSTLHTNNAATAFLACGTCTLSPS
jgi:type IV pilus assembly protein PilB